MWSRSRVAGGVGVDVRLRCVVAKWFDLWSVRCNATMEVSTSRAVWLRVGVDYLTLPHHACILDPSRGVYIQVCIIHASSCGQGLGAIAWTNEIALCPGFYWAHTRHTLWSFFFLWSCTANNPELVSTPLCNNLGLSVSSSVAYAKVPTAALSGTCRYTRHVI